MDSGAICDVVVDAHREGVRLLEDHTDIFPDFVDIGFGVIDVLTLEEYLTFNPHGFT
jgi:hypothetical protein